MGRARAAAVGYRRDGWCPIPIKEASKQTALARLAPYLDRPATDEEIRSWSWPGVGIVTGHLSGVLVLDVDGPAGEAELQKHGHPVTPMARTPSGGLHLYFKHPEQHVRTGIRVGPGLDVKAAGGYVVAPPSTGPNGRPYEWIVSTEDAELADPPDWLMHLIEPQQRKAPAAPVGEQIPAGRRNKDLASIAGTMRRRGMGEAEILAALQVANERRCSPPLEAGEVEKIAASVARYEPEMAATLRVSKNGHGSPTGILLSQVVPERVEWLWPGRIPFGKLTLIDGDPGTGKSGAATDLAARVSAGKPLPDGSECKAGGVVILSAEDGLADTIRPRFDAAGGDPSKVVAVSTVPDAEGNERQIAIPDDLHVIEAAIERVGAVLVVIDPLMAFLPGEVNSHRDQDVRRALAPLARLAERTGAAIVVIRHLNKATGGNALYRGGGSIGIVGAARSGLLIAKHPEDEGRRVLASIKSNLAAPAPSLVFGLEPAENGAVWVSWKGESNLDASALLSAPTDHEERSALSEAQEFLREILADGPVLAKDAQEEARGAGIAERTLKRARSSLGVVAERKGEPGQQGGGRWYWSLSEVKGATPKGWHSKPAADRTDAENVPYVSQNGGAMLRGPSREGVKDANGRGPLNPSPSGAVRKLLARPPGWLADQMAHVRREGAPRPQLEALAAGVAAHLAGDSTRGREVLPAVEAFLTHEVGCDCEECV